MRSSRARRPIASLVSGLLLALSPGLEPYARAALILRPARAAAPLAPAASVPAPSLSAAAPLPAAGWSLRWDPRTGLGRAEMTPLRLAPETPSPDAAAPGPSAAESLSALAGAGARRENTRGGDAGPDARGVGAGFDGERAPADVRGRAFVLVGGESMGRDFLLSEPARTARALGLRLILVDEESRRPASDRLPPGDFVAAPAMRHDRPSMEETAARVVRFARDNGLEVVGSGTFFNAFVESAAFVRDALRAAGHPVPGDAYAAVHAANDKRLARQALAAAPDVAVPAADLGGADEAAAAFRRISAAYPGRKVVIKPKTGAGKIGVRTDIASAADAVRAYQDVERNLREFAEKQKGLAGLHSVDDRAGIMMELQLEGPEVDLELVLGPRSGFAAVVGNPRPERPYQQEKGFTLPSQLSHTAREELLRAGLKALEAAGLGRGNYHVEMIYDRDLGPRLVEFNTRMGGNQVFHLFQRMFGYSLIEQGVRAFAGLPVEAPSVQSVPVLLSRTILPRVSGTVRSIKGLDELARTPGIVAVHPRKKAGDAIVAPQDGYGDDDYGDVLAVGADYREAAGNLLRALAAVEIEVQTPDGRRVTQRGDYGQRVADEVEGDPRAPAQPSTAKAGLLDGVKKTVSDILSLPSSFLWGFTPGWTMNAIGQEIQAVALPLFAAALYGLPIALLITGLGYLLRIAGAWIGSALMQRINPVRVNNAAIVSMAVAAAAIGAVGLFHAPASWMLAAMLANSAIGGIAYGVTRGVAENLLPRMILGKDNASKMELALNYAYQWVELSSIIAAMKVAEPLLRVFGGSGMMLASAALIAASALFYSRIKFAEAWQKPARGAPAAAPAPETPAGPALGLRDYLPFILFRFMHFLMYGVLATLFAVSIFPAAGVAGHTIGLYDGGSWLFSLLASLSLLPKHMGPRAWALLGAGVSLAFLWSAVLLHAPLVTMALGGLLGGIVTINSNKWMSFYSSRLPQDQYRSLARNMMTASTLPLLLVFGAVSALRLSPAIAAWLPMPTLLLLIAGAVTAAMAAMLYGLFRSRRPR